MRQTKEKRHEEGREKCVFVMNEFLLECWVKSQQQRFCCACACACACACVWFVLLGVDDECKGCESVNALSLRC